MTIQQATIHGETHTEFRQNPKDPRSVEKRLPSGRWQVVKVCDTPTSARALLFQLAGRPPQGE